MWENNDSAVTFFRVVSLLMQVQVIVNMGDGWEDTWHCHDTWLETLHGGVTVCSKRTEERRVEKNSHNALGVAKKINKGCQRHIIRVCLVERGWFMTSKHAGRRTDGNECTVRNTQLWRDAASQWQQPPQLPSSCACSWTWLQTITATVSTSELNSWKHTNGQPQLTCGAHSRIRSVFPFTAKQLLL